MLGNHCCFVFTHVRFGLEPRHALPPGLGGRHCRCLVVGPHLLVRQSVLSRLQVPPRHALARHHKQHIARLWSVAQTVHMHGVTRQRALQQKRVSSERPGERCQPTSIS